MPEDTESAPFDDDASATTFISDVHREVIADRTGELVEAVHNKLGHLHHAKAVAIYEPGTGCESIAVLKPGGGIEPLPAKFFDEYRDRPRRYTGTAKLSRLDSFTDHVNRFKTGSSALFAVDNPECPSLTAVLDYHEERNGPMAGPMFGEHRAQFAFPLSDEWKLWIERDKVKMSLREFAEFLEDRFVDVEHVADVSALNDDIQKLVAMVGSNGLASPSKLIELSRGLTIHEKSATVETRNLASGEGEIRFKSEHTDANGVPVSIPSLFILVLPVFQHGDFYRIAARLRYRSIGGSLSFWYELWGADRVFDLAFGEACKNAAENTELPLFFGQPE